MSLSNQTNPRPPPILGALASIQPSSHNKGGRGRHSLGRARGTVTWGPRPEGAKCLHTALMFWTGCNQAGGGAGVEGSSYFTLGIL